MVALSAAQAASRVGPGGRVGILASPAVLLTKLFDAALARYGSEAICPADRNAMLAAIRDIERQGRARSATDTLAGAGRELADEGARVQLVARSEFPIASDTLGCASSSRRLVPRDGKM
jgi:aspartate racemase